MTIELAKSYDPHASQAKWIEFWDRKQYFKANPKAAGTPYTIVIPPPNVTGALHLGHALNNTLQDVLIRWRRMQGYNVLWIPGTDHAGIATQATVERAIFATEKKTRHDIGREELINRIWQWKEQYEKRILLQLKSLGASCDWSRTRFTLDPICAKAVRQTFFQMFKEGYIYRGKRLVNWDTQLQTSVADDETYTQDTKGSFWTFHYPLVADPNQFLAFSTTRPETMLGDSALCVHPNDDRYKHLIGQNVLQPHTGREIPIIADALLADPQLGTGCVKVTPAHDPNDYACYARNPSIEIINILNADGTINAHGGKYQGIDRLKARDSIIADMDILGYFLGKEERQIPLKFSDRSKTPIEPLLSDQWFVKMSDRGDGKPGLAQMAIDATINGDVRFFPERYARTYLDWLGEKRDWCVSRQLWWGHQIPIWYTNAPESVVKNFFENDPDISWIFDEESSQTLICGINDIPQDTFGDQYSIYQDSDVLDTWFSSALWPQSTLGWPEPAEDFQTYYPTSTLCTSRDIITLWVARMVMTSLYNQQTIPFRDVYIHPKVMDGFGEGMSKMKGNGVDPLDIIALYGADALRYGMLTLATETQDSRLPVSNICPHCNTPIAVKSEHMYMRTKKLICPQCQKAFRPGGPWPSEDPTIPTAKQGAERFELGRNFANKLWNATRYLVSNLDGYTPANLILEELPLEDRWILSRLATTSQSITTALEKYRFSDVSKLIYDFAWSEFCDWYIEMSKARRTDPIGQRVFISVLDGITRLIQPIMPFLAESLWEILNEVAPNRGTTGIGISAEAVCIATWPVYPSQFLQPDTESTISRLQELVKSIREIRNRYILDKTPLNLQVKCSSKIASEFESMKQFIHSLGNIAQLEFGPNITKPINAGSIVRSEYEAYIPLVGLIDVKVERKRLEKEIQEKSKVSKSLSAKLANTDFIAKAPEEVIHQQKELLAEIEKSLSILQSTLHDLI